MTKSGLGSPAITEFKNIDIHAPIKQSNLKLWVYCTAGVQHGSY